MKRILIKAFAAPFLFCVAILAQSANDGFNPSLIPASEGSPANSVAIQADGKVLIGGGFSGAQGIPRKALARFFPNGSLDVAFNAQLAGIGTNEFAVSSVVVQPDQKILIGGNFLSVGGFARSFIARLEADGSVDTAFSSPAATTVSAIVLQTDGKIIVVGGISGRTISRLNSNGTVDSSFNAPNVNFFVSAIAQQRDGRIVIGGFFSTVGATTRNNIARLNSDGSLDTSFNPNANSTVTAIALQNDGKIVVAGSFSTIGGNSRPKLARLLPSGGLDFDFDASWTDPALNFPVCLAIQADGRLVVGGSFTTVGGVPRNRMARFDAFGGLDPDFDPNVVNSLQGSATPQVNAIAIQGDQRIVIVGDFMFVRDEFRGDAARLDPNGRLDRTLDLNISGLAVYSTVIQTDGRILIGGQFNSVLATARSNFARLESDGTLDSGFDPVVDDSVSAIAVQQDGKILIGGSFATVNGQPRNHIARLNGDGTLDPTFDPNVNAAVQTIAIQADGKVLIGGSFTTVGGVPDRNLLARVNADGTLDTGFNPNISNPAAGGSVLAIAIQRNGMIVAGGEFLQAGGQDRLRLARFEPVAGAVDSFHLAADGWVGAISILANGQLIIGGDFTTLFPDYPSGTNSVSRGKIARINPNGTVDPTFIDPEGDGPVYSIAAQADGKVVVGGGFTNIGGQTRNRLVRLNADGTADGFNPSPNGEVYAVALQTDGKLLVGGGFTMIDSLSRNLFARIAPNSPPRRRISTFSNGIFMYVLNGRQYGWVDFEYSVDNGITWIYFGGSSPLWSSPKGGPEQSVLLGTGELAYGVTGASLPTNQNLLIRAKGFENGSSAPDEFVWTEFLLAPTAANVSVSGRVFDPYGRPLSNAVVTLADSTGASRSTRTGSFGSYRFDDIAAGQSVVIGVRSKQFQYDPRVVNVSEALENFDFSPINAGPLKTKTMKTDPPK